MKSNIEEMSKKWAEIVAKAWMQEGFKKELLAHPEKVLKEHGIDLHGTRCKIHADSKEMINLVLPNKPAGNLSEQALKAIAAADSFQGV